MNVIESSVFLCSIFFVLFDFDRLVNLERMLDVSREKR
jgi:hypothetical protein